MSKILITDTVYPKNKGDNAILLGMLHDLDKTIVDAEFTILSLYPEEASHDLPHKVLPSMGKLLGDLPLSLLRMLIILFMVKLPKSPAYKTIEAYRSADIVISCGGSFVTDTYFFSLYKTLYGYFITKQLKKPLVLYAQTIGPFRFHFYKKLTSWILNKADIIITRDEKSYELLKKIGVNTEIHSSVDAAINLPPADKDMLAIESLPKDKFLVGISTREWIYPGISDKNAQIKQYIKTMAKISDYLIQKYDAHIVFLSTCFGEDNYRFNDVEMALNIHKLMEHQKNVTIVKKPYSASEIKTLFGQMDICICTRMHTLIFATTMYVPSIGIKYEFKTHEYMKMLELDKYTVDIVNIKYEEIKEKVDNLIKNKEKIKAQLKEKVPILQQKSMESARIVSKFLKIEKQNRG